jgi:predicted Zn-dependent protease
MSSGFNALAVDEGRVFTAGKVGEKLLGENITIRSDKYHPLHQACPFDGEGAPTQTLTLIDTGVIRDLACDRVTARRLGMQPTGHAGGGRSAHGAYAGHWVLNGGDASLDGIIRNTQRAILVTRTWYENIVDPMEVIVTGMTRDGLFLVEDGQIRHSLRNFRFNQNVLEMLRNARAFGIPELAHGMVVPPVLVDDFHFSSATSF